MVKKIGFVHTGVAIADMFKPMIAERLPGVSTFHIVDDSLIQDLLLEEKFTPSILIGKGVAVGVTGVSGAAFGGGMTSSCPICKKRGSTMPLAS